MRCNIINDMCCADGGQMGSRQVILDQQAHLTWPESCLRFAAEMIWLIVSSCLFEMMETGRRNRIGGTVCQAISTPFPPKTQPTGCRIKS